MNIYNQFIEYLEQEEKKFDLNTKNLETIFYPYMREDQKTVALFYARVTIIR